MNDNQVLAAKPIHSKIPAPGSAANQSSTALQGATSAFTPTASTAADGFVTKLPNTVASAKYAALAAGFNARGPGRVQPVTRVAESPVGTQATTAHSKSLISTGELTKGLARSTTSSNTPPVSLKPHPLPRSTSAIAAQRATSRPNSPQRSPARSPQRYGQKNLEVIESGKDDKRIKDTLSGAVSSLSKEAPADDKDTVSIQTRILNFEKLPSVVPSVSEPKLRQQRGGVLRQNTDAGILRSPASYNNQVARNDYSSRVQSPSSSSPSRPFLGRDASNASTNSIVSNTSRNDPTMHKEPPPIPIRRAHRGQHNSPKSLPPDSYTGMTVNSLADAMIGASLASSRAASPVKKLIPTPLASRRRSRSYSALSDLVASYEIDKSRPQSRPPRPRKPFRPMKHTLRKPSASDDEEPELVKRGRRHWVRKHPNMHHEGDRKRWRDKVTEAERRRYEGVFAANRGLHIGPGHFTPSPSALSDLTAQGNRVVNVVVRDIWERSRLPHDILMEIYDLVCPEEEQSLGKDQFVAGMWLIDQRLKGRKLPVKISASVWASIRHPDGIKLRA